MITSEMFELISKIDISTPEKIAAFKKWQYEDGTIEGLRKLYEAQQRSLMSDIPDVFVIGTIKMLAQLGETEKIVELCNEWLDKFESRPTQRVLDEDVYCACETPMKKTNICVTRGLPIRHRQ